MPMVRVVLSYGFDPVTLRELVKLVQLNHETIERAWHDPRTPDEDLSIDGSPAGTW